MEKVFQISKVVSRTAQAYSLAVKKYARSRIDFFSLTNNNAFKFQFFQIFSILCLVALIQSSPVPDSQVDHELDELDDLLAVENQIEEAIIAIGN